MSKLIVLIFRSCLDDEQTLPQAYERVLRTLAAGGNISVADTNIRAITSKSRRHQKDWRRVLHQLMPLCNKNASIFVSVMQQIVKHKSNEIVVSPKETKLEDDSSISEPNDRIMKLVRLMPLKRIAF